jgi:hypothetical protein
VNHRTDTIMDAAALTQGRKAVLVAARAELEAIATTLARTGIADVGAALPGALDRLADVAHTLASLLSSDAPSALPVAAEVMPEPVPVAVELSPAPTKGARKSTTHP